MKRQVRVKVEEVATLDDTELAKAAWEEGLGKCWHDYRNNRFVCAKCNHNRGREDARTAFAKRRQVLINLNTSWPIVDQWAEDPLPFLKALEVIRGTQRRTTLMFGLTSRDICIAGVAAARYRREVPSGDSGR